ncbi:MAG: uroporphyrinogen methyltransferase / synthase [Halanaerobiales bacterium]|nr:uroporphyrinogen methyltransferase / synthase [Halanaerobiales bacterium]
MEGKVYLVGAGPGDEGLITVKGLKAIKEADVILYDYLVNERLLAEARDSAELIFVGKKAHNHYCTQAEINQLLIEYAREGKIVTRLKGGDPFVFGRGGEEARELARENLRFEIIPGITSAIAGPAYAGIPVTHRNISSSVAFVTGHEASGKGESGINWNELATGVDTLVILMGVGNLPEIVSKLLEAGRDVDTPVALIRCGTKGGQETLVGSLDNIVAKVREVNFKPPAIIIVGDVVNLRAELNWFETRPLFGKSIVVTRPARQATSFCNSLREAGANVIKAPAIKILPPEDYSQLDEKLEKLASYDWVVFTSVNGVKYVIERLFDLGKDVRSFAGVKLGAIGSETAAQLRKNGLQVDYLPDEYVSEAIIQGFKGQDLTGKKFLLPRADIARKKLQKGLEDLGAVVDNVTAYRIIRGDNNNVLIAKLRANEVDLVTFTSSSTVHNFIQGLANDYQQLLKGVKIACIGPITAQTVEEYGLEVDIVAGEYTVKGLLTAIQDYYKSLEG